MYQLSVEISSSSASGSASTSVAAAEVEEVVAADTSAPGLNLSATGVEGSTNGHGNAATFNGPTGVAVDFSGNVYAVDHSNHLIRKIDSSGNVTTLAGQVGVSGDPLPHEKGFAVQFHFVRSGLCGSEGALVLVSSPICVRKRPRMDSSLLR